jgi:hypothetical protein
MRFRSDEGARRSWSKEEGEKSPTLVPNCLFPPCASWLSTSGRLVPHPIRCDGIVVRMISRPHCQVCGSMARIRHTSAPCTSSGWDGVQSSHPSSYSVSTTMVCRYRCAGTWKPSRSVAFSSRKETCTWSVRRRGGRTSFDQLDGGGWHSWRNSSDGHCFGENIRLLRSSTLTPSTSRRSEAGAAHGARQLKSLGRCPTADQDASDSAVVTTAAGPLDHRR